MDAQTQEPLKIYERLVAKGGQFRFTLSDERSEPLPAAFYLSDIPKEVQSWVPSPSKLWACVIGADVVFHSSSEQQCQEYAEICKSRGYHAHVTELIPVEIPTPPAS